MAKTPISTNKKGKDARWPLWALFFIMWASMIVTTLNTDAIKPEQKITNYVGGAFVVGIVIFIATARCRGTAFFDFPHKSVFGNLGWHLLVLTGIIFISFLCFDGVVQVMMFELGIPMFEPGCAVSERDTALFVWDAMAKGAFKFLAKYLHVPAESCAPNTTSWTVFTTAQIFRGFTALVVVWHVVSFLKVWYAKARSPAKSN